MLFIFRVDTIRVAYPLQVIFRLAGRKITCNGWLTNPRWSIMAPFGTPVEPDVYMI